MNIEKRKAMELLTNNDALEVESFLRLRNNVIAMRLIEDYGLWNEYLKRVHEDRIDFGFDPQSSVKDLSEETK